MKAIILSLATCIVLSTSAIACGGYGNFATLSISSMMPADLYVTLDNDYYKACGSNFEVDMLDPGRHKLIISKKNSGFGGTFTKVIYNGYVTIPASSRMIVSIGKGDHVSMVTKRVGMPVVHDDANCDNDGQSSGGGQCSPDSPGYSFTGNGNFGQFKQSLAKQSFDGNRISISKQYISSNGIAAADVLEIMKMMTFDSNRLELAKYAYEFCYDQGNYFLVNEGFSFRSSVDELNEYIG